MSRLINLSKDTMTTARFEQHIEEVKNAIKRYRQVEQSEELREYNDLKKIVESSEFQQKKKYLLERKYRDTEEGKTMRTYLGAKVFPSTQKYLAIADSSVKDKPIFKRTQAWRLSLKPVKDYLQLDELVNSDEFKERNAFWRNPKRWYTTPESKQDERYTQLAATDDIKFFLAQDPKQIAQWEAYSTLWADEMDWMTMGQSDWQSGFYYNNKNLKTDHSYFNEQQANNKGRNTSTMNSVLKVETKPELVHAAAWHPTKGFVDKEFSFTGDVIQTAEKFQTSKGIFLAKVRAVGSCSAALYLATGDKQPVITMMHSDGQAVSRQVRQRLTQHYKT